jgi:hypothetical protein
MKTFHYIPDSTRTAAAQLRLALTRPLETLPKPDFIRAWSSIAYLFPGLHPDGFEDADSGWPRALRRFAAEAWRRAEAGQLGDAELYASDAQWSGLCDQIKNPTPEESNRRRELAELSLECAHG